MPKVSIIIPTRNRADLLRYALASAAGQTYRDVEIVVCNNDSHDDTENVVDGCRTKNLVYHRTEKPLSMPENWERALEYANGDHVAYLADDSYLLPGCISTAMAELARFGARVAVWRHGAYFAGDWLEPARRNLLHLPRTTSRSWWINSRESLQKLFNMDEGVSVRIPKCLNSLCHRDVIEQARSIQNRFFLSSCPDYSSAAAILLNVSNYVLVDLPLYVDGVTTASIGATTSYNLGRSTQAYLSEFQDALTDIASFGIVTSSSAIAASLEAVGARYPNAPPVNHRALVCAIVDRLQKAQSNGADVGQFWTKLRRHLSEQPWRVRVAAAGQKVLSSLKWKAVRRIRFSPSLQFIEGLRGMKVIDGKKWRFHNIAESASVVENMVRRRNSPYRR